MNDLFSSFGSDLAQDAPLHAAGRRPGAAYFAFKPERDTASNFVKLGHDIRIRHELAGEVSQDVLHMSACWIGDFPVLPEERVEAACKIAGGLRARPFEIVLDRVRTYPTGQRKQPLVAFASNGAPEAKMFRQMLLADLRRSGFSIPKKSPDPHVTLFYDRESVKEEPIDPIRWMVRDFALVHSIHGEGRHVLLGQWSLCD